MQDDDIGITVSTLLSSSRLDFGAQLPMANPWLLLRLLLLSSGRSLFCLFSVRDNDFVFDSSLHRSQHAILSLPYPTPPNSN